MLTALRSEKKSIKPPDAHARLELFIRPSTVWRPRVSSRHGWVSPHRSGVDDPSDSFRSPLPVRKRQRIFLGRSLASAKVPHGQRTGRRLDDLAEKLACRPLAFRIFGPC